jgi:hypothetical protein
MPLNTDDEVGVGSFGGLTAFYGLNNAILGTAGRDAKAIPRDADGLVVAGVDG